MIATRQERRGEHRRLMALGQTALRDGLPLLPPRAMVVGLGHLLRDCLTSKAANPASRAAELVHRVFEASLAQTPAKLEIACRKGCGFCCHTWVSATAPELFLIAKHLGRQPAGDRLSPAAVRERAAANTGLDIAARFGAKLPCVFLADNACSIYAVRPTVCRQATSTTLATCIDEYEGRGFDGEIMVSKVYLDHARNCRLPLLAALAAVQLPNVSYELSAGISRVLETPDAEALWLDGTDIFAGVAYAPAHPLALQQAISVIADSLA
jgi:Fe-S-cluster containining protein